MRTRTRSITVDTSCDYGEVVNIHWDSYPEYDSASSYTHSFTGSQAVRSESLSDVAPLLPEVYVDPKTGSWKRTRRIRPPKPRRSGWSVSDSRLFGANRDFKPVKYCSHTKTAIDLKTMMSAFTYSFGAGSGNPLVTRTFNHGNVCSALNSLGFSGSLIDYFNDDYRYSSADYIKTDWFALMDKFTEASDSFVLPKFLAGEDMAENDIFIDAFKLILNPSKAVSETIKFLTHPSNKKFRRITLKDFIRGVKSGTKGFAGLDLFYKFAIKPAISDIRDALDAHDFVNRRMQYLRQNSGSWVPVRVRSVHTASFDNEPFPERSPGSPIGLWSTIENKRSIATISAWGRVRDDLEWNDAWSAYLQYFGIGHMIGLGWELIPFSFVIDWFTNAQERINHFTRLRTGGPFVGIRGLSASQKDETVLKLTLLPGYSPAYGAEMLHPSGPMDLCQMTKSVYTRTNYIPETSGVVDTSSLGLFHFITSAELVAQRLF